MSDDTRLQAFWAADEPPPTDPVFVIATIARVARRRLWADVAALVSLTVAVAGIAWATSPLMEALGPALPDTNSVIAIAMGLVLIAFCVGDSIPIERNS